MARKKVDKNPDPGLLWSSELIQRLKKYIDGNRYFEVYYRESKVLGMDLAPDEYPPEQAEFYMEEYDDARPDGHLIAGTKPEDFKVYLKMPIKWTKKDPDWSECE